MFMDLITEPETINMRKLNRIPERKRQICDSKCRLQHSSLGNQQNRQVEN